MNGQMNGKLWVLLVYPGPRGTFFPELPLPLLYLAWALRKIDFNVEILDMRITDYQTYPLRKDYLFAGITAMTGPMIGEGINFAKHLRKTIPGIPVIWGGIHPTLLIHQTLESKHVDIVVKGEGEETIQELAVALRDRHDFSNIQGIGFKRDGKIQINPDRAFMDLNAIDIGLPYDLVDVSRYEIKAFPVHTSRGCPFNCGFCYNLVFNKRRWRCKDAGRVLEELEYVVRRFGVDEVSFVWEDEFFIRNDRVREICEGIVRRGLKFKWGSFCTFSNFLRLDDDFLKLLERAGCKYLSFGGESGSDRILKEIINKPQKTELMLKATEKIAKTNICQLTSFMCGFPTETEEDWHKTLAMIDKLTRINPKIYINGIFLYTPYPGTPMFDLLRKDYGYMIPQSLEEWTNFGIYRDVGQATWVSWANVRKFKVISILTRFPFYHPDFSYRNIQNVIGGNRFVRFPFKQVYYFFSLAARWRWRKKFFKFPLEFLFLEKMMLKKRGFV